MIKSSSLIGFNKRRTNNVSSSFSNRGMELENDINISNEYYRVNNKAFIYKKPTPIKLVNVDYTKGLIKEAYFETPSTTDYNGIYKGRYVDFEAKETNSKTSFALSNIHKHQVKHLIDVNRHGAIAFIIVRFNLINKTFLLDVNDFERFIKESERKSIPIDFFKENAYEVKLKYNPRIDYLEVVEKVYFGGKS